LTDNRTVTPDLAIDIGRIHLKNPVIACSGTVASGLEYNKFYNVSSLGAITTKSFSIRKKPGNPPPRIWETPSGMLNSIGLQNEGIDFFIKSELPEIKETGAEIILSIFGEDAEEFLKIAKKVIKIKDDIMAIELNFSCPNVDAGGMAFCAFPEQIRTITAGVKEITGIPLIVKLSPNYQTITESAEAAKKGGAWVTKGTGVFSSKLGLFDRGASKVKTESWVVDTVEKEVTKDKTPSGSDLSLDNEIDTHLYLIVCF